jgi:hypothetical protein
VSRVNLIRDAQRPKLAARALFQGPQGSGKTWTMLSVARQMAVHPDGTPATVLVIDTERESALTYADVFTFKHLPWQAPYDPAELTGTLDQLATHGAPTIDLPPLGPDDVLLIDSFSHYWQGTGGILDIANGRVQGGWDKARPIQNALIEQVLAMPCHVLLGARMKNTVLVSDNGKTIENVGLTIVQDDALAYELNVVLQLDTQHNATVMKSRTPAVPVGRVYPGGLQDKLAADYTEWLAGGIPPANREDVERVVAVFAGITDKAKRKELKDAFVEDFGMPHALTAESIPAAFAWLAEHGAKVGEGPAADNDPTAEPPGSAQQPEPAAEGTDGTDGPEPAPEATTGDTAPAAEQPAGPFDRQATAQWLDSLDDVAIADLLTEYELAGTGTKVAKRRRVLDFLQQLADGTTEPAEADAEAEQPTLV